MIRNNSTFKVGSVIICKGIKGTIRRIENQIIDFFNYNDNQCYWGYINEITSVIQR